MGLHDHQCDGYIKGVGPTYAFNPYKAWASPAPSRPAQAVSTALTKQIRERGVVYDKHETPEEWWYCQADFYGRPVPDMWCWIHPGPVGWIPGLD